MRLGGCGAVTACDICIYLSLYAGRDLYPYDLHKLTKQDYIKFSEIMKKYLTPRAQGIDTLELFMEGLDQYFYDVNEQEVQMEGIYGDQSLHAFKHIIQQQIEKKMPVPYLNLDHKDPVFRDYVWHWFWLAGYAEFEDTFMVKAVTYGSFHWLSLKDLFDTGYKRKGGLIVLSTSVEN